MRDLEPWLTLLSVKGLGPRSVKRLLESLGDPVKVLEAEEEALVPLVGRGKARSIRERHGVDLRRIRETEETVNREGIGVVTLLDPDYPRNLRLLPDPPPLLFYLGELRDTPLVGIVGPRRPSHYTLSLVDLLVSEALGRGYGTVSGGAPGVDTRVHLTTVRGSGYTLCVLGCGLLKAGDRLLKTVVASGGALVSELMPEDPPARYTFPRRNRIIAGLSEFLIVPEAGPKSGSLITVRYARAYRREVFAHTGPERSERWEGCLRIIREGVARPFRKPEEVFGTAERTDTLERFLKTPRTFDEIVLFLGLPPEEVMRRITVLEVEGKVRREGPFYLAC
jgi:DNA processing protein